MIYEFRTYEASPGRLADLDRRFKDLTLPIFERLGIEQVGFWIPEGSNALVYILRWADKADSEAKWKAFQDDGEWQRGKAASEANGPILAKVSSQFWVPTEYSALR